MLGEEDTYRIRIGDYRAIYEIDYEIKVILIANIDKRSKAIQ